MASKEFDKDFGRCHRMSYWHRVKFTKAAFKHFLDNRESVVGLPGAIPVRLRGLDAPYQIPGHSTANQSQPSRFLHSRVPARVHGSFDRNHCLCRRIGLPRSGCRGVVQNLVTLARGQGNSEQLQPALLAGRRKHAIPGPNGGALAPGRVLNRFGSPAR